MTISYDKYLNDKQLEAVLYDSSPLLVLAGAGSGKTRVITYKIAYLIDERGYEPGQILGVTFTNKACSEMKDRVCGLLGERFDIWIRTFHSTAARLLRIMGKRLGVSGDFSIIDQKDQNTLIGRVLQELNLDTDTYQPGKYVHLINRAKDRLLTPGETDLSGFSHDPVFQDVYAGYDKIMRSENLFDFGDLIMQLSKALDRNTDVRDYLRNRFRYVLVDEFQDTNHAQYVLIKQLTLPEGTVCVVGDDDQSIYGFRGARVENILHFSDDYRGCKTIKLEENYRSYQAILTASSKVIGNNPGRLGKTLFTKRGEGEKLVYCRSHSDYGEARYTADTITRFVRDEGYKFSDFAVFYRMNAQSRIFESTFTRMNIPYTVVGSLRFYEREEIKDILSYLRLALNPMDEVALRRIINKPPRGIGKKTLQVLFEETIARGHPFHDPRDLQGAGSRRKNLTDFIELMIDIKDMMDRLSPPDAVKSIYRRTGYLEWLINEGKDEKKENLGELYNAVIEFASSSPGAELVDFVEDLSLSGVQEFELGNTVHLITLHNAKGLEFPVVFMAGMEDGIFPHYLAGERQRDLQEERRLCYVGMTRAMEKLYLTAARQRMLYGRTVEREPSIFLEEIPKDLLIKKEGVIREQNGRQTLRFTGRRMPSFNLSRPDADDSKGKSGRKTGAGIKESDRVVHEVFGSGIVSSLNNDIAEIRFDDGKVMKFMLKYTPIRKET